MDAPPRFFGIVKLFNGLVYLMKCLCSLGVVGGRFIFGTRAEDVARVRHDMCYHSVGEQGNLCSDLIGVFEMLRSGLFSTSDIVEPILHSLKPCNDRYLVTSDFPSCP